MKNLIAIFTGTEQKRRNTYFLFAALFLYIALNCLFLYSHINCRDEAQSWLLARDLSIPGLIKQMSYEGHPCMWHLLLMPFAKLGLPYVSMNILSLLIMSFAAVLLLWKAPFPLIVKLIILFSNSFVYYYPVVSRSYSLIPPILCLLACYYPRRHEKALLYGFLIALLIQTHVIMLGMAAALSLFWFGEAIVSYSRKKDKEWLLKQALGLTLPLLSLIFFLLQIMNVTESSAFGIKEFTVASFIHSLLYYTSGIQALVPLPILVAVVGILGLGALYLVFRFIRNMAYEVLKPIIIAGLALLFQLAVYALLYPPSTQRFITAFFIILWMVWVLFNHIPKRKNRIAVLCAVCIFFGLGWSFYYSDYQAITGKTSYSDSFSCASYIQENVPEDGIIIVTDEARASAVLPYYNRDSFYSTVSGEEFSFVTWVEREEMLSTLDELYTWAKENFPDKEAIYVLHSSEKTPPLVESLTDENSRLLYQTKGETVWDDRYSLYYVPLL